MASVTARVSRGARRSSFCAAVAAVGLSSGCGGPAPLVRTPAVDARPHPTRPPVAAAPSPLRRLTNEEYDNSVRDLLGDTARPAQSFPPDEETAGFETNSVSPVTPALVERYLSAAEAVSAGAAGRLDVLAPCPAGDAKDACAARFVERFGRGAFRRPLVERERAALLALYAGEAGRSSHERALQLVIEAVLQSPSFLYRVELVGAPGAASRPLSGYEVATRLSFFLWASTPDDALLDAASTGALDTADGVEAAARRLLRDPRAVDGVRSFHRQWLGLRELDTLSRDAHAHPGFTPSLRHAMSEETLRFASHATLAGGDVVKALLTGARSFVDPALARHYGLPPPEAAGFTLVDLPRGQRAGLLTHASVLTVHASAEDASPILRGKFVREKLLCQPVPPPPPNVAISLPKPNPTETKKERFARHRLAPSCASCHRMMDPIGFVFEHYDSTGAWRERDGASAVDAVGELTGAGDVDGAIDGAPALGERLAKSDRVRRCVATQWLRAALGRSERAEDAPSFDAAYESFSRSGFDARELVVAITRSDAFRHVGFEPGAP